MGGILSGCGLNVTVAFGACTITTRARLTGPRFGALVSAALSDDGGHRQKARLKKIDENRVMTRRTLCVS